MPTAKVNGVSLYYEVTGEGFPLIWSHEFAGDYKSWDPQVRFFSRRYQVITYNHRGFPPSEVPEEETAHSQELLVEDLHQLLRHLGIQQAFVGGLSMGASVALSFAIAHPEMTKALIVAGAGAGTTDRENFKSHLGELARQLEVQGWRAVTEQYARGPIRIQLLRKDPKSWREYYEEGLATHSDVGSVHSIRGIILKRPTVLDLKPALQQMETPTLIIVGDEDHFCVEPSFIMKQNIPRAGLMVMPLTGHVINLEEPDIFNRAVLDFLTAVEEGKWAVR